MDEYTLTCLQDVLDAIEELEGYFKGFPMQYEVFEKDYLRRSAVERKVEIMGEALNRILRKNPTFKLPNAKEVIMTRNRVIHGYDSVTPDFLWLLIIRHIPQLKEDILSLLLPHPEN
jgi:uncharacterized protein with HEPN domain